MNPKNRQMKAEDAIIDYANRTRQWTIKDLCFGIYEKEDYMYTKVKQLVASGDIYCIDTISGTKYYSNQNTYYVEPIPRKKPLMNAAPKDRPKIAAVDPLSLFIRPMA